MAGPVSWACADFSADVTTAAAPPLTVHFIDRSNLPVPSSWFWEFGDGATSEDQHPTHTYQQAGLFRVRLTVTGAGGTRTADRPGFIGIGGARAAGPITTTSPTSPATTPAGLTRPSTSTGAKAFPTREIGGR